MTVALPANVSRVRLRMFHSDRINAIYHGRVFDLFEEARTEVFRRLGFEYREIEDAGDAMIVIGISARFHAAARFDETVAIGVFVDALRKVQLTVAYEGRREGNGTLLFTGETSFAFVNQATGRLVRVPSGILRALDRCSAMRRMP
jgi:acyl-CoA thioester hydrolase